MSEKAKAEDNFLEVYGARVHNLKNVNIKIPRDKLVVITGLSGSGKSSLAFDTIYAEGQRRYIETFASYARQFLGTLERPDVDNITGLSPVISIEQKSTNRSPRSTVGTVTEIYDLIRLLFARAAVAYSYNTGEQMVKYSDEEILKRILNVLEKMFNQQNLEPTDYHISRWTTAPHFQGAYSFSNSDDTEENIRVLAKPVDEKLFFAGEATSVEGQAYAHGALMSGIREAKRLGASLKGIKGVE